MRAMVILAAAALLAATQAPAYPELVRRGYGNCVTCHVSPSGAGVLTEYGRSLVSEVMTTSGSAEESRFLYGAADLPDWLSAGGDFRALAINTNFNGNSSLKLIVPMQADVEAAATSGQFTFNATGGVDYNFNPISRRHYVMYHPTDELRFRAGRFMPAYGINTEDHAIAIKRGVGRDQSNESYNLEASWIAENFDVFVSAIFGRPDTPSQGAETGAALSTSVYFGERFKVGLSYYYGHRDVAHRSLAGPFAILGITSHISVLAEVDYQWLSAQGVSGTQTGLVDNVRLDFEVIQGLHFYAIQELSNLNFQSAPTYSDAYGVGAQWFPRPHIELRTLFEKQRIGGRSAPFGDVIWGLAHFYL